LCSGTAALSAQRRRIVDVNDIVERRWALSAAVSLTMSTKVSTSFCGAERSAPLFLNKM